MQKKTVLQLAGLFIFFILISCEKKTGSPQQEQELDECATFGNPDTLQLISTLKGYEIYARQVCGDWGFSLLPHTNALKTYDEVVGQPGKLRLRIKLLGKEAMKKAMQKIPATENLVFVGESWLEKIWGPDKYKDLQLPPDAVLNELEQAALQANLKWSILQ